VMHMRNGMKKTKFTRPLMVENFSKFDSIFLRINGLNSCSLTDTNTR